MKRHLLIETASKYPDRPALLIGSRVVTYSELSAKAIQIYQGLTRKDLQPGQIVALGDLSPESMITSIWACLIGNFIVFPLNIRFPLRSISSILSTIQPPLILSNTPCPDHPSTTYVEINQTDLPDIPGALPPFDESVAASLMMTSGSSGDIKYVQHSLYNHLASASGSNQNIPLDKSDRWLLSLPLYHIGGLAIIFRTALAGAAMVVPEGKASSLALIMTHSATHVSLVATQLQRIFEDESGTEILSQMKAILLGGSAISPTLIQKALDTSLPIFVSYGSTEMASQITTTRGDQRDAALLNSGKLLPGRDLIISHEGEILVKGETLAQGYRDNSRLVDMRDQNGWFHTRDIGYLNVHGELTVTGRMDNQFISGGENVQPEQIEKELTRIPGILKAVVVALADEEFGNRPIAFLETDHLSLNAEEISLKLRKSLPGYMIPVAYYKMPVEMIESSLKDSRLELAKMTSPVNKHLHSL